LQFFSEAENWRQNQKLLCFFLISLGKTALIIAIINHKTKEVLKMTEIKTIDLGDVTLAYKEYGTGDKYLISSQNFFFEDAHMALLGKPPYDYHCFLVYMRGYGKSTHITDTEPKNYIEIWGNDITRFAEAMGIPSFYYTGVSHGNFCGWHIAFNRPELLRGFVCVDGICQWREPEDTSVMERYKKPDPNTLVGNYDALEKMAWMENWPTQNPERLSRRAANHKEHTEILMGRTAEEFDVPNAGDMTCCNAKSRQEFYDKLSKIPVPTLIWIGGLDPLAKAEDALTVAQTIPGASLLTYQHLGHGGADECPELCARDCDRFFKDIEGRVL
jgi:pimeloyl-ACP methyl ester carboxylesterase